MTNRLHNFIRLLERRNDQDAGADERDTLDGLIARKGRDLTDDDRAELKAWKQGQTRPGQ